MSNAVEITAPEGQPFITIVREFDAPVAAVWRAHVEPDLVRRWLGPHGYETRIDTFEMRSGGRYRYVQIADGEEYAFNGVVHAADEHRRIVQTFEFEGMPDVVTLETAVFEELGGGRTRLTGTSAFPSVEARDGMLASGMETGVREGFERLDAILAEG
ncbi:uncharacterized protein YndB with AHSA1/START domain [Diaminobutyricimonas aerilata]|uniref:Uncharacterized protein YndB with AHSA1/START domain n=1 Tax=Diaminobutyricimonas aerilata TaxID=1162967 RepID=A0A2M9CNK9_9MICO|nr:SRPBCC family protein [Diaminobutyricimonas aerilata]PJJ73458.1 uncharacterized protein YndB with AHSA1/START domain [Diaminobutyricimonas aerilata]